MTVCSDKKLNELINSGQFMVQPLPLQDKQVRGAKVDLRLDNLFHTLQHEQVAWYDPLGTNYAYLDPKAAGAGSGLRNDESKSIAGPSHELPLGEEKFQAKLIPYSSPFVLHPGQFALGQTFETVSIPYGFMGRFDGRSSLARRGILVHITAAVIDPGYAGSITLELLNVGRVPVFLRPLMRIGAITLETIEGIVEHPYAGKFGRGASTHGLIKKDDEADAIAIAVSQL